MSMKIHNGTDLWLRPIEIIAGQNDQVKGLDGNDDPQITTLDAGVYYNHMSDELTNAGYPSFLDHVEDQLFDDGLKFRFNVDNPPGSPYDVGLSTTALTNATGLLFDSDFTAPVEPFGVSNDFAGELVGTSPFSVGYVWTSLTNAGNRAADKRTSKRTDIAESHDHAPTSYRRIWRRDDYRSIRYKFVAGGSVYPHRNEGEHIMWSELPESDNNNVFQDTWEALLWGEDVLFCSNAGPSIEFDDNRINDDKITVEKVATDIQDLREFDEVAQLEGNDRPTEMYTISLDVTITNEILSFTT